MENKNNTEECKGGVCRLNLEHCNSDQEEILPNVRETESDSDESLSDYSYSGDEEFERLKLENLTDVARTNMLLCNLLSSM